MSVTTQPRGIARFERGVVTFAERFLTTRTFDLIVSPALADCQFDHDDRHRLANRIAVCRALVGAARIDLASQAGTFVMLTLVPICYYLVLITVCFDFFSGNAGRAGFVAIASPLLFLSVVPVCVCFWPERRTPRTSE